MFGGHHETDRASDPPYRLRWPERKGVETLLDLAFLHYLVALAAPALVRAVDRLEAPLAAARFALALDAVLWLATGGVLLWMLWSGSFLSTHRYEELAAVRYHLDRVTRGRNRTLRDALSAAVGAALVAATHAPFAATFPAAVEFLVGGADARPAITAGGLAAVGAFCVGFPILARSVDRLLVRGLRLAVRRMHGVA